MGAQRNFPSIPWENCGKMPNFAVENKVNHILMNRKLFFLLLLAATCATASAQKGLSNDLLDKYRKECTLSAADKALNNAIAANGLKALAATANNPAYDTHFSNEVKSKGISNQLRSGRCWLYASLNPLRQRMCERYGLEDFRFSTNYLYFFDQLQKSEAFLDRMIELSQIAYDRAMARMAELEG